ncbi:iron complex outermembrane recepter protein [Pustulibacterium marinum]|uniref:Iron complex outermembrane recepter protein n=1 Tax=Pustulibacterium marinum TaxID=1224947 RepID=A0A1I7HV78_9FLAO|nr:TonB-dependent receptor [Pustulibacterium marinum]SFU64479.1 iron complex outermembrane recepter protein [Pustulibacterium marinum]
MRRIILLTVTLLCFGFGFSQNGKITGTIVDDETQIPLAYANITVNLTGLGATSNSDGYFSINNVTEGEYTIKISSIGYLSITKSVVVNANKNTSLGIISLQEDTQVLNEVVVENHVEKTFKKDQSITVSKMPLKDIENPQVYNTITNAVLEEQVVTNFDDALKNAPGLDKLWESTGRGGDGAGYFSLRGFSVQPTMLNGVAGVTNGSPDPANIESIEVLKGPSGTLYGSSLISYGGLINVNTKRPFYGFGGNVSYTGGSYGLNRITADVNTMLSKTEDIALRVNTAYHTQNSFQDAGFKRSFFVAPSISYQVNDKLSFYVNTEIYNGRSTNQTMLFVDRSSPLHVTNIADLNYNHKNSFTSNDLYIDTPTMSVQGFMNYKFNDNWSSQTIFARTSAKSQGYYSYLYEITSTVEGLTGNEFEDGIILARYTSKQNSETAGTNIQQNFNGNFNIGSVENKFVGGVDYLNRIVIGNNSGYGNQGFVFVGNDPTNFQAYASALHDYFGTPMATNVTNDSGVLTQAGADAGIGNSSVTYSKTRQQAIGAYVSDVAYLLPNVSVMASLRVDHFINDGNVTTESDDYEQTTVSPKFGVVYQPILDKVSVFANYMNGFSNVAPVTTPGGNTLSFDPEQANQIEFGTKLNLFNNKLSATLSYYDVQVSNTVIQLDPENYIQDGEQRNKGFEAMITGSPVEGLNIIAGYSYNDSKLEKAAEGNDFLGRRPESAGPQNLANLWASYRFNGGSLDGFGIGFGGNYASENKIFNRNTAGTFTLPEYTVLNASAFYEVDQWRFTLKLDNITNKEYYKGWSTISPQMLRSLTANLTYNF